MSDCDAMMAALNKHGWTISQAWTDRDGGVTVQFCDPNKYPPELRATWPEDRFRHHPQPDPVETGRGWHNFKAPTLTAAIALAVEAAGVLVCDNVALAPALSDAECDRLQQAITEEGL